MASHSVSVKRLLASYDRANRRLGQAHTDLNKWIASIRKMHGADIEEGRRLRKETHGLLKRNAILQDELNKRRRQNDRLTSQFELAIRLGDKLRAGLPVHPLSRAEIIEHAISWQEITELRKTIPLQPGVYFVVDMNGQIIDIDDAIRLEAWLSNTETFQYRYAFFALELQSDIAAFSKYYKARLLP